MTLPAISPTGVGTAWVTPTDSAAGSGIEQQLSQTPGDTNPPVIFEPNHQLSNDRTQVWIIATGGPQWGGCQVWASVDDTTYGEIGLIGAGGTQGRLTTPFPTGSDPDVANVLSVDVSESRGSIISGTTQDADKHVTLAYVDGELIGYSNATLTSSFSYDLDAYARRGCYGTANASHASGTQFARISSPMIFTYPQDLIGTTLWFKFPAFNTLGGEVQDLADCVAYPYVLTGFGLLPVTGSTAIGNGMLPLVTGALPGPDPVADGFGQYIGVPI